MNIRKLSAQILINLIYNMKSCHKRYVGDGKIYSAIGNHGVLESLNMDFCIRIKQFQDVSADGIDLNSLYVAATAHVLRHLTDNIADTGTAFKHVATLESHSLCNVPKGIYHHGWRIIGTVDAHGGIVQLLFTQQVMELTVFRCGAVIEEGAHASPA